MKRIDYEKYVEYLEKEKAELKANKKLLNKLKKEAELIERQIKYLEYSTTTDAKRIKEIDKDLKKAKIED